MPTISWSDDCQVDEFSQRMIETLVKKERTSTSELAENSDLRNTDAGRRKVRYRLDNHLIPGGLAKEIQSADRERVFAQTDASLDFLAAHAEEIQESKTLDSVDETAKSAIEIAKDASETVDERVSSIAGEVGATTQRVEDLKTQSDQNAENITQISNGLEHFDDSISELRNRIDDIDEIQDELEGDVDELHTAVDDIEVPDDIAQRVEQMEDLTSTLRNFLTTAMADIEELEDEQQNLERDVEETESELEEFKNQIEQVHTQITEARRERSELLEQQQKLSERVKALENQGLIDIGLSGK
jgi:chromosome segregation ATPase